MESVRIGWLTTDRLTDFCAVADRSLAVEEYWRRWWDSYRRLIMLWVAAEIADEQVGPHFDLLRVAWVGSREIAQFGFCVSVAGSFELARGRGWLSDADVAAVSEVLKGVEQCPERLTPEQLVCLREDIAAIFRA